MKRVQWHDYRFASVVVVSNQNLIVCPGKSKTKKKKKNLLLEEPAVGFIFFKMLEWRSIGFVSLMKQAARKLC